MVLSSYSMETPSKDKLSYLQNRLTKRMQFKSANNFFWSNKYLGFFFQKTDAYFLSGEGAIKANSMILWSKNLWATHNLLSNGWKPR